MLRFTAKRGFTPKMLRFAAKRRFTQKTLMSAAKSGLLMSAKWRDGKKELQIYFLKSNIYGVRRNLGVLIVFPGRSDGKKSACDAGDQDSISGLGRSGEGNGNPLQYSCLGNPMDRGAWQTTAHGFAKGRTWCLSDFNTHGKTKQQGGLTCGEGGNSWLGKDVVIGQLVLSYKCN